MIGAEMGINWPQEALKAQAVASRSYALQKRQTEGNALFDLGDTVAWQVYKGVATESPSTQAAVNATQGQVLSYGGRIIQAVFHSSSGGHTENVEDVWSRPLPYLRGVPDYDQGSPVFQWMQTFSRDQISQRISGVGRVISVTPARVSPTGRLISVRVMGDRGTRVIDADAVRSALGLKSTWFKVTPLFDPVASAGSLQSVPKGFQINGRGFGHGLGMSQWGAYNLSKQGYTYQQILAHYYQNTQLAQIDVR
ncbi:SpoIID/LytB domain-containing protein [Neosynechococcus sphagnicola]|uniref:SpoIID/LytB domain-containing protein n=1 Tax=Neosynechococcus sphagnicola TaxID=1501145 RepID=UPI001EF9D9CD|nr:SpoIID/LytB domain-containing protein [Neosynechococcus sphagnicola]